MMLIMMAKESSNLIGLENFGAVGFSITAGLGWYSPYQSISDQHSTHQIPPHPPPPTKFLHSPHENLMAMKVCCRQKNFSPPLKFWKFPLQLLDSVEAYLYVKNLTCCFESLWTRLATSTWNDWINVILLLLPYHMQKTNFITRLILEIKLTHYWLAL